MAERIALFIRSMNGGGAQRAMVRYANGFAQAGYAVDVLTLVADGPFREELALNVSVIALKSARILSATIEIAAYLARVKPTAMMVTEPACNVAAILARSLALSSTRLVVREGLFPSIAAKESPYKATRTAYRLAPWVYPRADVIVAIADDMADDLAAFIKVPRSRVTTIGVNPVVTDALHAAAVEPVEHPWFREGEPPVVLGVGRLEDQKDFGTLIRAFDLVRAERVCRLLILGDGTRRGELNELRARSAYSADIELRGFVANPFAFMSKCGVFVLPSRYEGLPNALIEALACGAPAVATDCPSGPRQILEGGRYGPLVPVGDHLAMATAIGAVLDVPPDRRLLRERGGEYTVGRSVQEYLRVVLPAEARGLGARA